jgi:hypothetical protein
MPFKMMTIADTFDCSQRTVTNMQLIAFTDDDKQMVLPGLENNGKPMPIPPASPLEKQWQMLCQ